MNTWQLQEAKAKFSQVVKKAVADGPQVVTVHGEETVVVLSMEEWRRLRPGRKSLVELLREAAPFADGLEVPPRELEDDLPRVPDLA